MKFEKKILLSSWLIDLISLGLILFYSIFSSRIPSSATIAILKCCVPVSCFFIFIPCSVINFSMSRGIANRLQIFESRQSDEKFRTALLMDLQRLPKISFFVTLFSFMISFTISANFIRTAFRLSQPTLFSIFVEWLCGSYFAGLIAYSFRLRLCEPHANRIVKEGVNPKFVTIKKNFGFSLKTQMLLYIAIPLMLATIVTLILYLFTLPENMKTFSSMTRGFFSGQGIGRITPHQAPRPEAPAGDADALQAARKAFVGITGLWNWRIKCTALLNAVILCAQILIFFLNFMHKNRRSIEGLEALRNSNFKGGNPLSSDLSDELSYNIYLINYLILKFQAIIGNSIAIAQMITDSSASLSKISDETEKNADNQSSKTGGIINRMDDNKRMSKEIDALANDVATAAQTTSKDMDSCVDIMMKTLSNMQAIGSSNESTLDSIKELQQKVSAIWQIVNMINSLAEQTKIIAFNTELESSGISGEEKSFLNVALETRRLANSIADSTKEIKDYIRQIEATEDQLLTYSVSNTDEIQQGLEISHSIESSFSRVNALSSQNAEATQEIKDMVQNQVVAFEQIRQTLIQVGAGIRNFTLSAASLVNASGELNASAANLSMTGNTGNSRNTSKGSTK